jgi:hypothetical protein
MLDTKRILAMLKAQHKVIDVPHEIRLSLHAGFGNPLKLPPSCLRFAVYVTGHHARLGARLLAKLCRGRHLSRLSQLSEWNPPPQVIRALGAHCQIRKCRRIFFMPKADVVVQGVVRHA